MRSDGHKHLRILVADDDGLSRDVAASLIRAAGHDVTCVRDGASAVAAVTHQLFDIVIMDVRMPVLDGLEATRRIRSLPGPRGQVPVAAYTVQYGPGQMAACRQAGMTGRLAKPFTPDDLQAVLAETMLVAPMTMPDCAAGGAPELPVIDMATFRTNTGLLRRASVRAYLQNMARAMTALLAGLQVDGARTAPDDDFLASVHRLAGMVCMCGLSRLADIARRFERAARTGLPELPMLAENLTDTLEVSLQAVREHLACVDRPGNGLPVDELQGAGAAAVVRDVPPACSRNNGPDGNYLNLEVIPTVSDPARGYPATD